MTKTGHLARLSFLILLGGWVTPAKADILFFNINWSVKESDAIRRAARATQDTVIEFPNFSDEKTRTQGLYLETLSRERSKIVSQWGKLAIESSKCGFLGRVFSLSCRQAVKTADQLYAQIHEYDDKIKAASLAKTTPEQVNKSIAKLNQEKRRISTVILSGHSTGDRIFGLDTDVNREFMFKLVQSNPDLFQNLDSIVLLACHSGEGDKLLYWSELLPLPHRKLVAGFEGSAPSNLSHESQEIVANIVKTRAALLAQPKITATDAQAWFKGLSPTVLETVLNVRLNEWVGGSNSKALFSPFEKFNTDCKVGEELLNKGKEYYELYYDGLEKGFETIPTDKPTTHLRIFYRNLQKYAGACGEYFKKTGAFPEGEDPLPSRESVIALIHLSNLQRGFIHGRAQDLAAFNDGMKALGAKKSLLLPDELKLGVWSRKSAATFFADTEEFLNRKGRRLVGSQKTASRTNELNALRQSFRKQLLELKDIPVEWIIFE